MNPDTNALGPAFTAAELAPFVLLTGAAATTGAILTQNGKGWWYRGLRKSRLNPPDAVFAPVWTVLYALSAVSGARVHGRPASPVRTRALALWCVQLALNTAWSGLFFGQRRPRAAFVELLALLGGVTAYAAAARRVDRSAAWMIVPYIGWTAFAGWLNLQVLRKNPRWLLAP